MMENIRIRAFALVAGLALATGLLAACGGDDAGGDTEAPTETTVADTGDDAAADTTTADDPSADDPAADESAEGYQGGRDGDLQSRLADLMLEDVEADPEGDFELTRDEAECYAGILVDEVDNDLLRQAIDAAEGSGDADAAFEEVLGEDAISESLFGRIFSECFDMADLFDDFDLDDFDLDDFDLDVPESDQ